MSGSADVAGPASSGAGPVPGGRTPPGPALVLLVSVFIVAACGLVYELVAGALASYLLGDSVLQFSTIIGAYLFAMGCGAYLSRFLRRDLAGHFIRIETAVGLVGGFMPLLLFVQYVWAPEPIRLLLYGLVFAVGVLAGIELPLVMRLLRQHYGLRDLVSQVMTVDYLGALAVSLAFPLWFAPVMGMVRTGLFFGLANVLVALWALWLFRDRIARWRAHLGAVAAGALALLITFAGADRITGVLETSLYGDRIVHATNSPYQRIVVTSRGDELRLYLNGNLQFSSVDEHRYHEALVLPVLAAHPAPARVLILGGGDGMAARELLASPAVRSIVLVDLDPEVTSMFSVQPTLRALNRDALRDPRVTVVNTDAFKWVEQDRSRFDLIIVDLPDPTNFGLNKLYSRAFYGMLAERLSGGGFLVLQATSPLYARRSFWTIVNTVEAAGLQARPYQVTVPSFGPWGFVLAGHRPYPLARAVETLAARHDGAGPRFLTAEVLPTVFVFPPDMSRVQAPVNRLLDPVLLGIYRHEWGLRGD